MKNIKLKPLHLSLLLYLISNVFSSFLNGEISQAKNIKNKLNKNNVIRILNNLKDITNNLEYNENGYIICSGIDIKGYLFNEIIYPDNLINKFIYKCDKKFDFSDIYQLFDKKNNGNLILIDGDVCFIYSFIADNFKRIKKINANLIKRQSKGGQSAIRFARLAEESRYHYVSYVIDIINQLQSDKIWIFGSKEIKNNLIIHKGLLKKLNTNDDISHFNDNIINEKLEYFKNLFKIDHNNDKKYEQIYELIEKASDMLTFELDNIDEIEYLIINYDDDELEKLDKIIKLEKQSKYYEKLKNFKIIGKKYY